MPKLHLKYTPEEKAAQQKAKRRRKEAKGSERTSSNKRRRETATTERNPLRWVSSDDEQDVDPRSGQSHPHPSENTPTKHGYSNAELEQRFRERMFEEMEYDERLDSLEARLNDFAHVPERWRAGGGGKPGRSVYDDSIDTTDPQTLDDEEYVEWIRAGMYRKTHAKEYAEQQHKKALDEARRAETARLAKATKEEQRQKKLERENFRWYYARRDYELRWKELLSGSINHTQELRFRDIPWPILTAHRQKPDKRSSHSVTRPTTVLLEELTTEAISRFLLSTNRSPSEAAPTLGDPGKKERKDTLKETLLRFHPDKFEGRFMKLVKQSERDGVRNGIGQVVRILNILMSEGG